MHLEIEEITSIAAAILIIERFDSKSIASLNCSVLTLTPTKSTFEVTRVSVRSMRFITAIFANKS